MGRVNGACTVCPDGSKPAAGGSACSYCQDNQILFNGKCICKSGYAFNSAGVCSICSSISGSFLVNGICSVCPGNLIYDGVSKCTCPAGKVAKGSLCISQCQNDELLDTQGNCYTCKNN